MVKNGKKRQKNPLNNKDLTVQVVKTNLITNSTVKKTMRRSVTIEKSLHNFIIELRGWWGMERRIDLDYTTVLNMLAKLGADDFRDISKLSERQRELITETINSDPTQKVMAAADDWWTQHLKVELPEYDPEVDESLDEEEEQEEEKISVEEKG